MKLYLLFGLLFAVLMATVMAAPAPAEEAEPIDDLEGQEILLHLLWKHHLKKAYKYGGYYPPYAAPLPAYGYSPYYYGK